MAISFALSEDELMIRNEAEKFGKALYDDARKYEKEGVPASLYGNYKELGFLNLDWPAELGGQGLPFFVKTLVLEQLSRGCVSTLLHIDRAGLAVYPLLALTDSAAKSFLLDRFKQAADGFEPAVFVDTDGRIKLENGVLTGDILYLPCHKPSLLILLQGRRVVCIEDGLDSTPVLPCALHSAGACGVRIGGKPSIVEELSEESYRKMIAGMRLYAASCMLGVSVAAYQYALGYTKERITFGKKVAHHQGVAFILADMSIAIEATRAAIWKGVYGLSKGDGFADGSQALLQAQECASFVTVYGVQLLGGHGYVNDYPVEKWMREARTLPVLLGGKDAAQIDLERTIKDWAQAGN